MPAGSWLARWNTGDNIPAAEMNKGVGMVFDSTLGSSAASIDTGAIIPAGYGHLRIVCYLRGDNASANTTVALRFNNDSAANYFSVGANFTEAATGYLGQTAAATSSTCGYMPANTATASHFGSLIVDVPNYAGTANVKSYASNGYVLVGAGAGNQFSFCRGGVWTSASAISRVTLLPTAGNFVTGCRATVYVMGA